MKTFEQAWEHYQEHAVPPLMTEEQFRGVYDAITPPEKSWEPVAEDTQPPSGVPHVIKGRSTL